uniref:Uncharacterized protein n=1 Tax=Oncorhynchus tshawytscha TaxID=74940 RepID=A0A8C8FTR3_ONCTS
MVNNRSASRTDTLTKMESQGSRCKIVVVGDTQCGKTALLHVFAKDCYPENYVPTVFENYTASFEIDKQRIELNMWDTSGSSYYDNVRPLAYPDSDAVLVCFDISRPETLDSVLKKWQGETQEFCPNAKVVLVGCKLDMRTDVGTLRELSKQRLIPITHEQEESRYRTTHHNRTKQRGNRQRLQEKQPASQDSWTWEDELDGKGPWAEPGEYRRPKAELEAAKAERRHYDGALRGRLQENEVGDTSTTAR